MDLSLDHLPGDTDVATPSKAPARGTSAEPAAAMPADTFQRIGQLTRTLHDALRELGYDRKLEEAARRLPDAQDRLSYIGTLTGQAAERVLSAVEQAQVLQQSIDDQAAALDRRWMEQGVDGLPGERLPALAADTRAFLRRVRDGGGEQNRLLTDIMMAQDFHDLTGQVLKRVAELARGLEGNLVELLLESRPAERKRVDETGLTGPVVGTEGRTDVVTGQAQVDDLLESLGF